MGVLLFVSFAAINIAIKGSLFSSSGRDSQYAFYAADAGLECAFYWDSKFDAFATSTSGNSLDFKCAGSLDINSGQAIEGTSTITTLIGGGGNPDPTSRFGFVMNQGGNSVPHCAIVTVEKYYIDSTGDGFLDPPLLTKIKSRGYNTCVTSFGRRMERGVEVNY